MKPETLGMILMPNKLGWFSHISHEKYGWVTPLLD